MVLSLTRLNWRSDKVAADERITRKFIHFSANLSAKVMANIMEPPIWSCTWQFVSHTRRIDQYKKLIVKQAQTEQSDPNVAETQGFREPVVLSYLYTCCKGRVIWVMSIDHSVVAPRIQSVASVLTLISFLFEDPGRIFLWHLTECCCWNLPLTGAMDNTASRSRSPRSGDTPWSTMAYPLIPDSRSWPQEVQSQQAGARHDPESPKLDFPGIFRRIQATGQGRPSGAHPARPMQSIQRCSTILPSRQSVLATNWVGERG